MDMPEQVGRPRVSQARVVFGLIVMVVGSLMLVDRLDWWGFRMNVPIWAWLLIVLGVARLADQSGGDQDCTKSRRLAAWFVFMGAWGLLNEYQIFGAHPRQSWPLLLIGAGVFVVWGALQAPRNPRQLKHD
jgi:hypothetical protein